MSVAVEDYSGGVDDGLTVKAEGPKRRPEVYLPKRVQVWMIYTNRGELRAHAMREGNFADRVNGWLIRWDNKTFEYILRKQGRATIRTTVKHEAYLVAESDGKHRPRHHG